MSMLLDCSAESLKALLPGLNAANKRALIAVIKEREKRKNYKLYSFFPNDGPFARHGYTKHLSFFKDGAFYGSRLFMAGNRVGKTIAGTYEDTLHATGLYPDWWKGKRFDHPTKGWIAGKTNETTRDILQVELFGNVIYKDGGKKKTIDGTGIIPIHLIDEKSIRWKSGVADLIDTVKVKHASGGWSYIGLKSYQQGRGSFEGTAMHYIHLDEEPPEEVYTECLTRTATTRGLIYITFTPLMGVTPMVKNFIEKADEGINSVTRATWDDAPHLTEDDKANYLALFPKHEHKARMQGIPYAGSGLIYPIDEDEIIIEAFDVPAHWPRIKGLDFGWDHPTSCVELAWDRDNDIIYVINEYSARERTPQEHAPHINDSGSWQPVAWPHDGYQHDKGSGKTLAEQYEAHGVNMLDERATHEDGSNGVEAGLMEILTRMEQGRFMVFDHCTEWQDERRTYHRDKGKIVKLYDDLMDATRYAVMMLRYAQVKPRAAGKKANNNRTVI
ncbi:terminase large subunit domain-containing protein [Psychrobacter sp. Marseille-P5312]|uniref:terminase large subunit domain-containing protein n=1 Tax=Psychrobacter sp. Marseille-P5312 TaxID=2086574 RepID=UPI001D0D2672|nr:terminase family protein [Psychrobacter sp. Marseille-P5312]